MRVGSIVSIAGALAVVKKKKFENGEWLFGVEIDGIPFVFWAKNNFHFNWKGGK